jgi:predicted ABC-type sugar transport system permease subunit
MRNIAGQTSLIQVLEGVVAHLLAPLAIFYGESCVQSFGVVNGILELGDFSPKIFTILNTMTMVRRDAFLTYAVETVQNSSETRIYVKNTRLCTRTKDLNVPGASGSV